MWAIAYYGQQKNEAKPKHLYLSLPSKFWQKIHPEFHPHVRADYNNDVATTTKLWGYFDVTKSFS